MRVLTAMGLTISLVLAGCYRTHTRGEDAGPAPDTTSLDARSIDARTLDTPAFDAPLDAPFEEVLRCECCPGVSILSMHGFACSVACLGLCGCADRRPAVVCFRAPVADVPIDMEVQVPPDDCYCGQTLRCSVEALEDRIGISSQLCPGVPCEVCGDPPPTPRCTIPARPEGRHHVSPNVDLIGGNLFELDVLSPSDPEADADVCIRPSLQACGAPWAPEPLISDRACHASAIETGTQAIIEVEDACSERRQPGYCTVSVRDSVITVRPTRTPSRCPGFGRTGSCAHPVHTCVTPRLAEGRYTVIVEGLTVTDGSPPTTIDVVPSGVAFRSCRGSRR